MQRRRRDAEKTRRWTGLDTPDFVLGKRTQMRPDWSRHPTGIDALGGDAPFIMEPDCGGRLFGALWAQGMAVAHALRAGRRSVAYLLYPQQINPAASCGPGPAMLDAPQDPRYPRHLHQPSLIA